VLGEKMVQQEVPLRGFVTAVLAQSRIELLVMHFL